MTRRLSVYLLVAVAGTLPAMASEAYTDRVYASKTGSGSLADLGSPSYVASTYSTTPVYATSQVTNAPAQTTPLSQLAESATMITYSSTVSADRYLVSGIDRSGSSAAQGGVQNYASTTTPSTITNGYEIPAPTQSGGLSYTISRGGAPVYALTSPSLQGGGDVTFNVLTPEPGTWAMMASALAGLAVLQRRRRASK